MSLKLIIGRAGTGKTTYCLQEIERQLKEAPEGNPIIYLVPEQMTFLSEFKLATSPHLQGMIRAQVYSFSRLAWRVLQETGGFSRNHISSIGISMLIRKILEEQKEELRLYKKTADKKGFVQQLESILTEFKRYCVRPEELFIESEDDKILLDKLHDLEKIYQSFEQALFNQYIDSEDYLRLLRENISKSEYLKKATIYVDGFYSFTTQELMILQQLMKYCQEVTITLTLDKPYKNFSPEEMHLFRQTGETCATLYEMAKEVGCKVEEIIFSESKRFTHPSLSHLEKYFETRPTVPYEGKVPIFLGEASNRRTEVEGMARKIRSLVQEEGYRYRDIAIIVRNGADYYHLLEMVFNDYELPIFIDQKRSMENHPLIEFIRSTLEIIYSHWRYEAVFRAVKTELLFPVHVTNELREKVDRFENYVLAYGIQGDKWTKKERWRYYTIRGLEKEGFAQTDEEKNIENEINELKELISAPIVRLQGRLQKAKKGVEYAEALYLFLEELEIPKKLEKWKMEEEEEGNLVVAREHEQAWNGVVHLLDQFVEILGEEEFTVKNFAAIMDAGLEALRFSLVPPSLDQVIVANMENSRLADVRAVFIPGLNEGVLPAKFTDDGVLTDEERETLHLSGMKLAPSSKTKLLDEEFIAYKAFTTATECLYISYPLAQDDGRALTVSPYVTKMKEMFPKLSMTYDLTEISSLSEEEQLAYISHPSPTLSLLTAQLSLKKRNYPIYDIWWDVYNLYMEDHLLRERADKVFHSLDYRNKAMDLSENTSKQLYSEVLQGSVSRLEMFAACPFSHFAQYGLRLRERKVFRLEAPDIGELFHGALKYIVETVVKGKNSWKDVSTNELDDLAKEAVEVLAPKLQNEILLSSNRYFYIKRKLEQIIRRAASILKEHAVASGFSPVGLELAFGRKQKYPPMTFTLRNGMKMELNGRIDRIDKGEDEQGVYLRIIDYKSSSHDLNLVEVYHGLALQMLTYLDFVITHAEEIVGTKANPAGVLYFHVHNPFIQTKRMLTVEELEQEVLKKFKMKGLILGEKNVFQLMDKTVDTGESSIVSAGIKKDGKFSSRSKIASKDEFHLYRRFIRTMFTKQGNAIMEGNVEISPFKLQNKTACTFCSFKSVCQFDEGMEGNGYRILPVLKQEELMEKMRKEVEGNE